MLFHVYEVWLWLHRLQATSTKVTQVYRPWHPVEEEDDPLALNCDVTTQLDDSFILVMFLVQLMLVSTEEFDDRRVFIYIRLVLFVPCWPKICLSVSSSYWNTSTLCMAIKLTLECFFNVMEKLEYPRTKSPQKKHKFFLYILFIYIPAF